MSEPTMATMDNLRVFETVGDLGLDAVEPVLLFKNGEPLPFPGSCEQSIRDVCAEVRLHR